MHTNRLTGILLVFLSLFCLTSRDKDDLGSPPSHSMKTGHASRRLSPPSLPHASRKPWWDTDENTSTPTKSIPTALARHRIITQT